MSGSPPQPFFQARLHPSFLPCEGTLNPRYLVKTSWQVNPPSVARLQPQEFESLLVLDDLVVSVLPFSFHNEDNHAIAVTRLQRPAEPWRGIACDLAVATMWILHSNERQTLQFRLLVRLPHALANPEPDYPLLGTEFLRHYGFRLELCYAAFSLGIASDPLSPVGHMELD
jgi:hypothetical protein